MIPVRSPGTLSLFAITIIVVGSRVSQTWARLKGGHKKQPVLQHWWKEHLIQLPILSAAQMNLRPQQLNKKH